MLEIPKAQLESNLKYEHEVRLRKEKSGRVTAKEQAVLLLDMFEYGSFIMMKMVFMVFIGPYDPSQM